MQVIIVNDRTIQIELNPVESSRLGAFCAAREQTPKEIIEGPVNNLLKDLERWCHYNKINSVEDESNGGSLPGPG